MRKKVFNLKELYYFEIIFLILIFFLSDRPTKRHKRARKELLDWYSIGDTLLEGPIFPCPYSRASSSQVQLHLDARFLGNSNSPLIRTKSDSLGFTSYIYCKFNFENPKPRSQQCFVAPFLCISLVIPVTASNFMLCLSEIQSPNALHASIFSSCAVPYSSRRAMGNETFYFYWDGLI